MRECLTWEVGDRSHLGHGVVEGCDDHRWEEGKVDISQGEALYDRNRHAAGHSFYFADTGLDHQSPDSTSAYRTEPVEAHASCSRHSHVAEGVREDSPVEGSKVCDSLWRAGADSRSTYRVEKDSSGKGRPPCRVDSLVVVGNPWRAGSCRLKGRRCDDLHDGCFLRG